MRLADLRVPDLMIECKLDEFASRAKVIHIDIDPAEVGEKPEVPIVGDVRKVLIDLLRRCQEAGECVAPTKRKWLNRINRWQEDLSSCATMLTAACPQEVIVELARQHRRRWGQHQWSAQS